MTNFTKNGLVLIGIIIIGMLGYYLFVLNADSNLDMSFEASSQARLASEQFLRELNKIKTVDLNEALFIDTRFEDRESFTQPILPEAVGRTNPFLPAQ